MRQPVIVTAIAILSCCACAEEQEKQDVERIRAARADYNVAIADHDVDRILDFLDDDYQITASLGQMSSGRDNEAEIWSGLFASREEVVYVRSPESIRVSDRYPLASESGTWEGRWVTANGVVQTGGSYAAMWRKVDGEWKVRTELFVALYCDGVDCP